MGWRPRLYLFSALGEFFSLRSACSHGWNLCWGLGARSGDWGGFRIVPVQGSATLPPRLAEPRAGNGMLGQADGEARGAGATGNGWRRLGSGIPGVPHAPVLAKHTPFWRLCGAELRGAKTARRKGGTGRGTGDAEREERTVRAAGRLSRGGARWEDPSLLGSRVRRHPGLKAAVAAAAAKDRSSRRTLPFANLFAVWACCT